MSNDIEKDILCYVGWRWNNVLYLQKQGNSLANQLSQRDAKLMFDACRLMGEELAGKRIEVNDDYEVWFATD